MGLCLSCLRFDDDNDDEFNERTSLLGNHHLQSDENIQEEILKQQQRQQELNGIVNDLNENLIDVSTFLNDPVTPSHAATSGSVAGAPFNSTDLSRSTNSLHAQYANEEPPNATLETNAGEQASLSEKQYPYVLGPEEKSKIIKEVENLSSSLKEDAKISCEEPLYLQF